MVSEPHSGQAVTVISNRDQSDCDIIDEISELVAKSFNHLGPEGGANGGQLVAMGRPEEIAAVKQSYTGQWLSPVLARAPLPVATSKRVAGSR